MISTFKGNVTPSQQVGQCVKTQKLRQGRSAVVCQPPWPACQPWRWQRCDLWPVCALYSLRCQTALCPEPRFLNDLRCRPCQTLAVCFLSCPSGGIGCWFRRRRCNLARAQSVANLLAVLATILKGCSVWLYAAEAPVISRIALSVQSLITDFR